MAELHVSATDFRVHLKELANSVASGGEAVVMARHGFGRGEYKYYAYPLPDPVAALRSALYARLVPTANRWERPASLRCGC